MIREWCERRLGVRAKSREAEELRAEIDRFLAGRCIAGAIQAGGGFLASRLGFTEALCLAAAESGTMAAEEIRARLWRYSGVFPEDVGEFERFQQAYCSAIGEVDMLGVIRAKGERQLHAKYARNPLLCDLGALEPYFCAKPWSRALAGRRVLVVHPFAESIRSQYAECREVLFADGDVLPEFDLLTVKPPQTIAGNTDGFGSWSGALENLQERVGNENYDVAILGCGAYGLPLGAWIKAHGKPCIHLGGATQILFGIIGARWKEQPAFRALVNKAWQPPRESERPPGFDRVEKGCYW